MRESLNVIRPVGEFVTPHPAVVSSDTSLEDALHAMILGGFRHLLVGTAVHPAAIVSLHDLHYALGMERQHPATTTVASIAVPVRRFHPRTALAVVARIMAHEKLGAVLVQDESVLGIFTVVDALRALAVDVPEATPPIGRSSTSPPPS